MSALTPRVAGIVLAAGMSTRFGANKLLAPLRGKPLVRLVAEAALASQLDPVVAVLGHQSERLRAALGELVDHDRLAIAVNPAYGDGQSGSVVAGLKAVQDDCAGAMFLMGDQPLLDAAIVDQLIAAYRRSGKEICYPSVAGKRRNPVIFGARFFPAILALTGDTGARALIDANPEAAIAVEFNRPTAFRDVDRDRDLDDLIHDAG